MSDAETAHVVADDANAAADAGHDREPAGEPLGPLDVETWAYAVGGGLVGLLVAAALFIARGG